MGNKYLLVGLNGLVPLVSAGSESLGSALARAGLLTENNQDDFDGVIVADYHPASYRLLRLAKERGLPRILIRNEPAVVCPPNYQASILRNFDVVIDVGRFGFESDFVSMWPQSWPTDQDLKAFRSQERESRCVLINANKLSFMPGELYSLRRAAASMQGVDLYGRDWDSKLFRRIKIAVAELVISLKAGHLPQYDALNRWFSPAPSFLGPVESKLAVMSKYKVALVVENSADYMSEKLHDALFAGCIPVYVGPPVETYGIPSDLVVQVSAHPDSIAQGINDALSMCHSLHLAKIAAFLDAAGTQKDWSADNVFSRLSSYISEL